MSLKIGLVMSRSMRITLRLFLPLTAIAVVGYAPHILTAMAPSAKATIALQSAVEFQVLDAVLAQLLSAGIAYLVILELRGTRMSVLQIPHVLAGRIFPIVVVGLVSQVSVLMMNVQPLFGLLALFVITVLFVSLPIVVIEQPGVAESLRRSAQLTYGRRWNILGLLGVFVIISLIADFLLNAYFGEQAEVPTPSYMAVISIYRACLAVFGSVVAAVTYWELRHMSGSPGPS